MEDRLEDIESQDGKSKHGGGVAVASSLRPLLAHSEFGAAVEIKNRQAQRSQRKERLAKPRYQQGRAPACHDQTKVIQRLTQIRMRLLAGSWMTGSPPEIPTRQPGKRARNDKADGG